MARTTPIRLWGKYPRLTTLIYKPNVLGSGNLPEEWKGRDDENDPDGILNAVGYCQAQILSELSQMCNETLVKLSIGESDLVPMYWSATNIL